MRLLLFCMLFPAVLAGQSPVLPERWSAEIEQDWVVDIPSLETERDSGITTVKLLRSVKNDYSVSSPFLADLFFDALVDEKIPVFKDAALTIPTDLMEVYPGKELVWTFDPETYEEKQHLVWVEPFPACDFKAWRLRQKVTYHRKNAVWSTEVLAIAPLVTLKNDRGDSVGLRPLCWFRPKNTRPDLHSDGVVWVKMTANVQQKTKVPVDLLSPPENGDSLPKLLVALKDMAENDLDVPLFDSSNEHLLSPDERSSLISRSDTFIYCFTEGPNGESTGVIHYDVLDDIHFIRLVQTWYWDERRRRLSVCLDAVAPMQNIFDNEGNFRFSRPLFYMRVKE